MYLALEDIRHSFHKEITDEIFTLFFFSILLFILISIFGFFCKNEKKI